MKQNWKRVCQEHNIRKDQYQDHTIPDSIIVDAEQEDHLNEIEMHFSTVIDLLARS